MRSRGENWPHLASHLEGLSIKAAFLREDSGVVLWKEESLSTSFGESQVLFLGGTEGFSDVGVLV